MQAGDGRLDQRQTGRRQQSGVGLVDEQDRRWAWQQPADVAFNEEHGWLIWTLDWDEAVRQDDGFARDRIASVYITALADTDETVAGAPNLLQLSLIGALSRSAADADVTR